MSTKTSRENTGRQGLVRDCDESEQMGVGPHLKFLLFKMCLSLMPSTKSSQPDHLDVLYGWEGLDDPYIKDKDL
jgi:hypothetical protein